MGINVGDKVRVNVAHLEETGWKYLSEEKKKLILKHAHNVHTVKDIDSYGTYNIEIEIEGVSLDFCKDELILVKESSSEMINTEKELINMVRDIDFRLPYLYEIENSELISDLMKLKRNIILDLCKFYGK